MKVYGEVLGLVSAGEELKAARTEPVRGVGGRGKRPAAGGRRGRGRSRVPRRWQGARGRLLPSRSHTHARLRGRSRARGNVQRATCMRVRPHTPDFPIAGSCIYV